MYTAAVLLLSTLAASAVHGLESPPKQMTAINAREQYTDQHHIDTTATTFTKLLLNSTIFIDRTLFIKEILEANQNFIFISAPPKFSKTINMDMVRNFIDMQVDKFGEPVPRFETPAFQLYKQGTLKDADGKVIQYAQPIIGRYNFLFDDYLSRYPVIYLDFGNFQPANFSEFKAEFVRRVQSEFQRRNYTLHMLGKHESAEAALEKQKFEEILNYEEKGHDLRLEHSIRFLTQILSKIHQRGVFVMVDNFDFMYDTVLHTFISRSESWKILQFMRYFYRVTFHQNMFLKKTIVTATNRNSAIFLPLPPKVLILNHALFNPYYPYFGVSETDVSTLESCFGIDSVERQKARDLYLGYRMGSFQQQPVYCTWSIVNYLNEKSVESYWLQISTTRFLLGKMMSITEVRHAFERSVHNALTSGASYSTNHTIAIQKLQDLGALIQDPPIGTVGALMYRAFVQYFCDYGFLTYNSTVKHGPKSQKLVHIEIPNEEIKQQIRRKLQAYYDSAFNIKLGSVASTCDRLHTYIMNEDNDRQTLQDCFQLVIKNVALLTNNLNSTSHSLFNYTILDSIIEYIGIEMRFRYNYEVRVFSIPGLKLYKDEHGAILKTNFYFNSTPESLVQSCAYENWFPQYKQKSFKIIVLDINPHNNTVEVIEGTMSTTLPPSETSPLPQDTTPPAAPDAPQGRRR